MPELAVLETVDILMDGYGYLLLAVLVLVVGCAISIVWSFDGEDD